MILDLAAYFGIEPDIEAVVEARNAAIANGYHDYVRQLYADAGITSIVFDFGIPLPMLDIDEVSRELPVDVVPIYRIEPLIADLLKTDLGWTEFSRAYDDAISDALGKRCISRGEVDHCLSHRARRLASVPNEGPGLSGARCASGADSAVGV